jgi:hypothetical protein
MAGQAGSERSVDDLIRDLSDKYGYLSQESPTRTKVMSPRIPPVSPFDILLPDFLTSQPAPVLSFTSAPVPSFPISPAPPMTTNTPFLFSPVPAHESMQFSNSGVSLASPSSIFGRKALTPPALSHFAPDTLCNWLDLFTEFLERFCLARY